MRIRYIVPFKRKVLIADHWPIPFQGGACKVIEENGYAKALEVVLEGQSVDLAPHICELPQGPVKLEITARDPFLQFIRRQLDHAMAFLRCTFDISLATEEIEVKYEGETPEEETKIPVKMMSVGRHDSALPLSYDLLTRAIMAAEEPGAPMFEGTLVTSARRALNEQQFIDSFRYSFLLIEALYGNGQFKGPSLKAAIKASAELRAAVEGALRDRTGVDPSDTSATAGLLRGNPSVDDLLDHLVDQRGFYFHGNAKRKDAWRPEQQGVAKALAWIAIRIAYGVTHQASATMFDGKMAARHFEYAERAGAILVFQINFQFREPEEALSRAHQFDVRVPGTKVTGKLALDVAKHFIQAFERDFPVAKLERAQCIVQGSQEKVFDLQIYAEK